MKIAVLGYGKQGKSAVDYWKNGNEITVCDFNENIELPDYVDKQLGKDYLKNLDRFNLIIRSPLIHPKDIRAANNDYVMKKVTTVTEEFMRNCPANIIGVTGTKGKGTTSTLITKFLEAAGKRVHLGGNIGIPPLEMLSWDIKKDDWVVLELANFQLIDLGVSPRIAVSLMVVPEHLDWHTNLEEYIFAKQNLFRHQKNKDLAVYNRLSDLSTQVAEVSPALKISFEVPAENTKPSEKNGCYIENEKIYMDDELVCKVEDVKLLGRHNLQNVCAAIAAIWDVIDNNSEAIIKVLHETVGLAHRLEPVRTLDSVTYYNDSFCSAAAATSAALDAVKQPKVLIVGGYDRKLDMKPLVDSILKHNKDIKKVLLIGETAPKIKEALDKANYQNYIETNAKNMKEIVLFAKYTASPGDAVLFSPGFASFDMFKNFEDRGLQFKAEVDAL